MEEALGELADFPTAFGIEEAEEEAEEKQEEKEEETKGNEAKKTHAKATKKDI